MLSLNLPTLIVFLPWLVNILLDNYVHFHTYESELVFIDIFGTISSLAKWNKNSCLDIFSPVVALYKTQAFIPVRSRILKNTWRGHLQDFDLTLYFLTIWLFLLSWLCHIEVAFLLYWLYITDGTGYIYLLKKK